MKQILLTGDYIFRGCLLEIKGKVARLGFFMTFIGFEEKVLTEKIYYKKGVRK